MQARGTSKLLSSPSVTTLDNHPANVNVQTTVYVEGSLGGGVNFQGQDNVPNFPGLGMVVANPVSQQNIGITLQVVPRLNEKTRITLTVNAQVSALLAAAEIASDRPRSTTRQVSTQVTVENGDTVILGGLIAENTIENFKYFPVLHKIPIIGRIFQSKSIEKEQRELLIFITPNVVG
jgi:general secretion pathway protein D